MSLRSFSSWWSDVKQAWRKRGTEEGRKLLEELSSQIRKMLIGAFLALILLLLGFPKLSAWYEGYKKRQLQPSREVFICVQTVEKYNLNPVDSVYVQVIGDPKATGYGDSDGICVIPYTAEQGENTVDITFLRSGYQPERRYKIALPETAGDTTYCTPVHLERKIVRGVDADIRDRTIFN